MADLAEPDALLHSEFSLTSDQLASLPPDVRDELLEYLSLWGKPAELLDTIARLRNAHGPLLFFLDYEAKALARAGRYEEALRTIDRRQRRSATIASLSFEALTLAAAGQVKPASAGAQALILTYPRRPLAVAAAAEVLARVGKPDHALDILDRFLSERPGHPEALLALAQVSLIAGKPQAADLALQQLGAGVSADLEDALAQRLATLHQAIGNRESERTVRLELERRRQARLNALRQRLAPILSLDPALIADPDQFYRLLSGPQSIVISDRERRKIQLEAVRHFGFLNLREGQAETVASILRGESLLVIMPTGAGKSLCYQLPALILPHATLVISPLIALMKDQVEGLPPAARSVAAFINSTLPDEEVVARLEAVAAGKYKLIYAAPERLRQRAFLAALRQARLSLFVIDEAHCVSMWGHDFRPDYLFLQAAREVLGNPPALAMTATAPPRVRDEIVDHLSVASGSSDAGHISPSADSDRISRPGVMALDIFRHNIHLSALQYHSEDEKLTALLQFVARTEGPGIVYVNSRHKSESLAYELRRLNVQAEAYHAGLDARAEIQDRFMSGATHVVVATIAFGMGIDKADIRFIVHFHPPRSLAAYYQEVGRAGRDGRPSQGVLFYSNNDWANLRRWAKADALPIELLEQVHAAIASQLSAPPPEPASPPAYPLVGLIDTRRIQQVLDADEVSVRVAISLLERVDALERSFDFPQETAISLTPNQIATPGANAAFDRLRKGLSLTAGQSATYKTTDIASYMKWPLHQAEANLLEMKRQGLLQVSFARRALLAAMPAPPGDMRRRLERVNDQSLAVAQRRIDEIIGYATSDSCRHGFISAHFGSPPRTHCTACDNCTGVRPDLPVASAPRLFVEDADIEPMILDCLISLPKSVGRSGLARILAGSLRAPVKPDQARHHGQLKALGEVTVTQYIDDLIDTQRLRQYEQNGYPVLAATLAGRTEAEAWYANNAPAPRQTQKDPQGTPLHDDAPDWESPSTPRAGSQYTALQKALWSWRRRLAEEQGVPPYMILDNNLMLRIAESRPQSGTELAALPGMGEQRLVRFGPSILDLVRLHPPEAEDEAILAQQRTAQPLPPPPPRALDRQQAPKPVSRALYLKLQELRQKIAVAEGCSQSEVAGHNLLKAIANAAPRTVADLERIPGFRSSGLRARAEQVCALVADAWRLAD